MGTDLNFNHISGEPSASAAGRRGGSNIQLTRQTSIYSLTFDELQNSTGASIKDFASMNMDELLKNIWTAEESHALAAAGGGLQRQGSLTLPRTMSHKTVDEIWKDMSSSKDSSAGGASAPTLGEITLEEFLVRAGVVTEDTNTSQTTNGVGFYADFMIRSNNNNTSAAAVAVAMSSGFGSFGFPHDPPLNVNVVRSSHQPPSAASHPQPQPLFPNQPTMHYRNPLVLTGGAGFGTAAASVSPARHSSDGLGKSNGDLSSLSPVPYMFNEGIHGRRANGTTVEKVVERRQRRMIKNRESAARSRARKQAYTMELEAEVAKLKDESQELQKKQVEIMEMQKKQVLEMMNNQGGTKRRRLRRTQTGPW